MIENGTRTRQTSLHNRPPSGSFTRQNRNDPGLKSLALQITATFNAGTHKITAAAATFAGFRVQQLVEIAGSNKNNGFFTVVATDASTYLTLDPPPKAEGPVPGIFVRST